VIVCGLFETASTGVARQIETVDCSLALSSKRLKILRVPTRRDAFVEVFAMFMSTFTAGFRWAMISGCLRKPSAHARRHRKTLGKVIVGFFEPLGFLNLNRLESTASLFPGWSMNW